jgi:flavin-dependent dehydrogenase
LPLFPELAAKLRGAVPVNKELGNVTSLTRLKKVASGNVALVGDASGSVDAITGQGLSLAFQQAICLADAIEQGDLGRYQSAHRRIAFMPNIMTRLMLLMDSSNWVRGRVLRLFQSNPELFAKLLSIHTGGLSISSLGVSEILDLGWKLVKA